MNAYQLDANGVIINTIVVDSLDTFPGLVDAAIGGAIGDKVVDGAVIPIPQVPTQQEYEAAVQAFLDEGAPQYVQWCGEVLTACYQVQAAAKAGTTPYPTVDELIAMLPVCPVPPLV